MANTINAIRSLLADKIGGLGGSNPLLGAVFEYPNSDFKNYPAAVILPTGGSKGRMIDTHRNERIFSFQISYYQEQTEPGRTKSGANDVMTAIVDATIEAFDQDKDLEGEVERVDVVKLDIDFKANGGTHFFAQFAVDCVVVVPNY